MGGVLAQRQLLCCPGSPGKTPANHPPYRRMHDPFKTASGVQNSGPWDPWLPGVENSRLFAQPAHSARPHGTNSQLLPTTYAHQDSKKKMPQIWPTLIFPGHRGHARA